VLPLLEPLLPAPLLPVEPLLLGLVVVLELGVLGVLELPLAPELEPDLLKYASHSVFDTCPSLLVSTEVKLGVELDAPAELLSVDELPEAPADELPEALGVELDELGVELDDELGVELGELPPLDAPDELPVAAGEDEDLSLLEAPVEDEPELCAMETLASANSAAAVAVVMIFNFMWSFLLRKMWGRDCRQSYATLMPRVSRAADLSAWRFRPAAWSAPARSRSAFLA